VIIAKSGQLWSTEHGPEGGDELNLLVEGTNYGWPLATYGTDYGTQSWPLTAVAGSHDGFAQPYFSWVPSIAVSSLVEITSSRFGRWDGDLIASSLKTRELWRLRIRDERVVLAERIPTDERIRQIIEGYDGDLVLWSDRGTIMFIESASVDAVSDQSLYRTCAGCHAARQDDARIAPSLRGIVGRSVAADREFDYSAAMLAMGGVWTRERLDAFLTNPDAFVPGTSMSFAGIAEPAARARLIDFLQSADRELDISAHQPP
jgi:cytochrome c2